MKKITIFCLLFLLVFRIDSVAGVKWYAGFWDSTIYNRADKPRTVGVRIEVSDTDTGLPVQGANIKLTGVYMEERPGVYDPQEREFELTAKTGSKGIAVFALSWQKKYPWSLERIETKSKIYDGVVNYDYKRVVDDVEKVGTIEIRHPRYQFEIRNFSFNHLLDFGQDNSSEFQSPELFERFETAWNNEIRKYSVKYCVLELGKGFTDFRNKQSKRREFFEKIRDKDFGTVYREPVNFFSDEYESGPYFVYLIEVPLNRIPSQQIDIYIKEKPSSRYEREMDHSYDEYDTSESKSSLPEEVNHQPSEPDTQIEERGRQKNELDDDVGERSTTKSKKIKEDRKKPLGVVGAVISSVDPSSDLYEAGLREGMVVSYVKFGRSNITPTSEKYFNTIMKNRKPGERIELGIWDRSDGSWQRDKIIFNFGSEN